MPNIQHESWFYEKFMMAATNFRLESAADWACLQVYDGNTLKPAMGQGFQGTPSSEQLENLYKQAVQGKLVFFDLTKKTPDAVTLDGFSRIEMNPVEPTEPVKPGENASNEEKSKYAFQNMKYSKLKQNYEKAVEALGKLGEGFEAAMEAYNSARDMQAEQIENESRTANGNYVKQQRRLNNADRLIDGAFGPRPVAVGGYFHHGAANPKEFSFQYENFDELFAANGYDLPADSKLNAQEVATINFAMAGASKFVEKYYKKELKAGDAAAKNGAGSFQPLVTSCFSDPRIGQPYEGFGVLNKTFRLGKDMVAQYNSGNAGPLGAHLADCVRNLKASGTGVSWGVLCADMVAGARLIERIQELFDKHEDIKQAANLTEKELAFMRGYVQLGKAYDHYLTGIIKANDAAARGEELSTEAKTEILADIVLRNLISKDLAADKTKHDADPAFQRELKEALQKDTEGEEQFTQWQQKNPEKYKTTEEELYKLTLNIGAYSPVVGAKDLDHGIIYTLAKNGMLEKMRSELMQNPAILEAAAKEPFEFSGKELEKSEKLDALVAQTEAAKDAWKTQVWYENMKTALVGSQPENWLNPNTPGDNNRLMVALTSENAVTGAKEVKLIGLDTLLEGGVKALENPSQETLLILQGHAAKGNLYYYDVGKDMPIRVGAEDAWATAEQLKVPPQPTLWQTIANFLTFGWAYADIFNPKPDKDPEVFEAILAARKNHSAAAQNEAQKPAQENKQVEKISEQEAELDQKQNQKQEQEQKQNQKDEIIGDQMIGRKLAEYNKQTVDAAIGRFALAVEKYMPAADKNTMGLTKEEVGVLAAIACGSAELSFKDAKSGEIRNNEPDRYYNRIISTHYAGGQEIKSKGAKSFHALARRDVKEALESGDMDKLGKLLADGLTQNNKWLSKQTDLSDYYTVYAELGGKLLNIVEKNKQLKQAFNKHLGENTNQIKMAKAAKNISDLRVKALPLKEQLMEDFTKYENGAKDKPLHVSTNEEIATICQLCMIQQSMKMQEFDLATTEYTKSNMVNKVNDFLKDSKQLDIFRTQTDQREDFLDDVYRMAVLYSDAISLKKEEIANQNQMQNTMNKQNVQEAEKQQEIQKVPM